jgi:DNA-binding protein HU-beta
MNTTDLVAALASKRGLSKAETKRLLDTTVDTFNEYLAKGQGFTMPGLGTFSAVKRDSRRSYNPHYDQYMELPPKRVVRFSPSKGLKEDVK